jgi:GTP cyclohydrolase II
LISYIYYGYTGLRVYACGSKARIRKSLTYKIFAKLGESFIYEIGIAIDPDVFYFIISHLQLLRYLVMNFFSVDEIKSNSVSRIINDLRRGLPVTISKKYLVAPAETLSESNFNKLKQCFKDKLMFVTQSEMHEASQLSFETIKSLCTKNPSLRGAQATRQSMWDKSKMDCRATLAMTENGGIVGQQTLSARQYQFIKKIFTLAKLLPVFLFVELDPASSKGLSDSCILNMEESDLASYTKAINSNLEQITANIPIPLDHSLKSSITVFRVMLTGEEHYAIMIGEIRPGIDPLVRLHSSCYTGDLLGSLRCDCNGQLLAAKRIMSESPKNAGVIIYLAQEGRGIGLTNKLRAYELQDKGTDTVEANELLGFEIDGRDYSIAAQILKKLQITRARLLTNNPAKIQALIERGILISEVLPLTAKSNRYNKSYIETKRNKLSHKI